ncbi:Atu4866 domain-containing protein [Actinomadura sp. WMMB 499]|uniref:Atu4866 domain-containing protein n=1 Tax=Actinomadura sp. WMMB 499 TaxID=1219491 RepID=UPI0020C76463|nr:Atu4866 domain-containing protein [Actinomadura sp. WMMB 499]
MPRTALALGVLAVLAASACQEAGPRHPRAEPAAAAPGSASPAPPHPHVGMWVTADGRIRQELLPNGRYEEARDGRERAYTGRYTVTGDHIDYFDDLGFTATGDVRDGVLYHEHLVLYRED